MREHGSLILNTETAPVPCASAQTLVENGIGRMKAALGIADTRQISGDGAKWKRITKRCAWCNADFGASTERTGMCLSIAKHVEHAYRKRRRMDSCADVWCLSVPSWNSACQTAPSFTTVRTGGRVHDGRRVHSARSSAGGRRSLTVQGVCCVVAYRPNRSGALKQRHLRKARQNKRESNTYSRGRPQFAPMGRRDTAPTIEVGEPFNLTATGVVGATARPASLLRVHVPLHDRGHAGAPATTARAAPPSPGRSRRPSVWHAFPMSCPAGSTRRSAARST